MLFWVLHRFCDLWPLLFIMHEQSLIKTNIWNNSLLANTCFALVCAVLCQTCFALVHAVLSQSKLRLTAPFRLSRLSPSAWGPTSRPPMVKHIYRIWHISDTWPLDARCTHSWQGLLLSMCRPWSTLLMLFHLLALPVRHPILLSDRGEFDYCLRRHHPAVIKAHLHNSCVKNHRIIN